jgi:solute carrier family 25 folate transporter 32
MWYGEIKKYMAARRGANLNDLSSGEFLTASATAGVATALCTNPIWVVKTRMLSTHGAAIGSYKGLYRSALPAILMIDGLQQIFQTEGTRGFYAGLTPALIGVSHGAVQFMLYEELKKWRIAQKQGSAHSQLVLFIRRD